MQKKKKTRRNSQWYPLGTTSVIRPSESRKGKHFTDSEEFLPGEITQELHTEWSWPSTSKKQVFGSCRSWDGSFSLHQENSMGWNRRSCYWCNQSSPSDTWRCRNTFFLSFPCSDGIPSSQKQKYCRIRAWLIIPSSFQDLHLSLRPNIAWSPSRTFQEHSILSVHALQLFHSSWCYKTVL